LGEVTVIVCAASGAASRRIHAVRKAPFLILSSQTYLILSIHVLFQS
jgi:hypothetical protein